MGGGHVGGGRPLRRHLISCTEETKVHGTVAAQYIRCEGAKDEVVQGRGPVVLSPSLKIGQYPRAGRHARRSPPRRPANGLLALSILAPGVSRQCLGAEGGISGGSQDIAVGREWASSVLVSFWQVVGSWKGPRRGRARGPCCLVRVIGPSRWTSTTSENLGAANDRPGRREGGD